MARSMENYFEWGYFMGTLASRLTIVISASHEWSVTTQELQEYRIARSIVAGNIESTPDAMLLKEYRYVCTKLLEEHTFLDSHWRFMNALYQSCFQRLDKWKAIMKGYTIWIL